MLDNSGKCDEIFKGVLMALLEGALRFDPESRFAARCSKKSLFLSNLPEICNF